MLSAFVLPFLRGCGQMLFQPSARTGSVFLALILSQSTASFLLCLAGVLGASLCAYVLEGPGAAYTEGEGGFNGGLLGLALSVFYEYSGVLLLVGLAGGAATGLIRAALLRLLPVPPFTAPFIVVAWPAFMVCGELLGLGALAGPPSQAGDGYSLATNASQVLFLGQSWVGALVLVAVWLHSRSAAAWLVGASLIVWLTTVMFDLPEDLSASGLLGYNGLILAAALQHRKTRLSLFAGGVLVSVGLSYLFFQTGVTPLSAPFVLSAWLVITMEAVVDRRPWGRDG